MTFAYLLAWLTPFALGASIVALLDGRPRAFADWMRVLGCGFVLGAMLTALATLPLGRVRSRASCRRSRPR